MVQIVKINRVKTQEVKIGNVIIGGNNSIAVQSMTNTDTADVKKTTEQIIELANTGSEIIRLTVDREESAKAIPEIKNNLIKNNVTTPLVGDFHYNGHRLLSQFPETASILDKYRINPGNVGFGDKQDPQFTQIIKIAIKNNKPVRIGVNWGSLDQRLLADLMDKNATLDSPKTPEEVLRKTMVVSALSCAKKAEEMGLNKNKIILSCKVSKVQDLIAIYTELSNKCDYALHLGLTEAGMGIKGIVSTTAALSSLLQKGIGDTIRASITPEPNKPRTEEVELCKEILQTLNIRSFNPEVSSCPGCGRTTSDYFQHLSKDINTYLKDKMIIWKDKYKGVENLKVAVMGCIVNGPGESKHADIGISLPGTGEKPSAPIFIDGKKVKTLKGENITDQFKLVLDEYVENRYTNKG